jgi:hypothetical protein
MNMSTQQTGWWTITEDKLADVAEGDRPAVGTCGPRECTLTADQIKAHPATLYFQMFDDDGEHYYSGLCILPQGLTDEAFRPLDDYGTPNAGCTSIKYRNPSGHMETL